MDVDTIRHVLVAAPVRSRKVVILSRRALALLIAVLATLSLTAPALGSPRDVINDYLDNGLIDSCHPKADYDAAVADPSVTTQYGDFRGVIENALENPALVGTDAAPCADAAEPADDGGGGGTIALIAVPIGLVVIGLGLMLGRRRSGDAGDDAPDPS